MQLDTRNTETANHNPFDDYLTKEQLRQVFPGGPISERTLDRLHTNRTGPQRIKVGRRVLYSKQAVRQWLESKTPSMVRESVQ